MNAIGNIFRRAVVPFAAHCRQERETRGEIVPSLVGGRLPARAGRGKTGLVYVGKRDPTDMRRRVGTGLYAGLLFTVLGAIAWVSGQPFIFPSLGPTAFVLAFDRQSERTQAYRVVGSHFIGGVAGLV